MKTCIQYLDGQQIMSMLYILQELNLAICGSQIVGLVPLKAILQAADYYMKKENLFILEEDQKLRLVGGSKLSI